MKWEERNEGSLDVYLVENKNMKHLDHRFRNEFTVNARFLFGVEQAGNAESVSEKFASTEITEAQAEDLASQMKAKLEGLKGTDAAKYQETMKTVTESVDAEDMAELKGLEGKLMDALNGGPDLPKDVQKALNKILDRNPGYSIDYANDKTQYGYEEGYAIKKEGKIIGVISPNASKYLAESELNGAIEAFKQMSASEWEESSRENDMNQFEAVLKTNSRGGWKLGVDKTSGLISIVHEVFDKKDASLTWNPDKSSEENMAAVNAKISELKQELAAGEIQTAQNIAETVNTGKYFTIALDATNENFNIIRNSDGKAVKSLPMRYSKEGVQKELDTQNGLVESDLNTKRDAYQKELTRLTGIISESSKEMENYTKQIADLQAKIKQTEAQLSTRLSSLDQLFGEIQVQNYVEGGNKTDPKAAIRSYVFKIALSKTDFDESDYKIIEKVDPQRMQDLKTFLAKNLSSDNISDYFDTEKMTWKPGGYDRMKAAYASHFENGLKKAYTDVIKSDTEKKTQVEEYLGVAKERQRFHQDALVKHRETNPDK